MARKHRAGEPVAFETYLDQARACLRDVAGNQDLLEGWERRLRHFHADEVSAHDAVLRLLDAEGFFEDD